MNVVVVLVLMMVVGCITLVSGMLIIIIEKKSFIGIMKALGAPTSKVRKVFVYLALRIALVGMIIGNLVALAFIFIQGRPISFRSMPSRIISTSCRSASPDINFAVESRSDCGDVSCVDTSFALRGRVLPAETMRND